MIHVYVAGCFTAPTEEQIEANILAAEAVAAEILRHTDQIVCVVPHSLGRMFKRGPGSPQYWYDATLSLLTRCDALVLVPGWESSSGTRNEVAWCRANDVPVFHGLDELLRELVGVVARQPEEA